jgi:hypothetical protein
MSPTVAAPPPSGSADGTASGAGCFLDTRSTPRTFPEFFHTHMILHVRHGGRLNLQPGPQFGSMAHFSSAWSTHG